MTKYRNRKEKSGWSKFCTYILVPFVTTGAVYGAKALISNAKEKKEHKRKMKEIEAKKEAELEVMNRRHEIYEEEHGVKKSEPDENENTVNKQQQLALPTPCSMNDIVDDESCSSISFHIDSPLEVGDNAVLYAPAKAGKSWAVVQLALNVAHGSPSGLTPEVLNSKSTPETVFIIDNELQPKDLKTRFINHPKFPENLRFVSCRCSKIDDILNYISQYADQTPGNVTFFIDSITGVDQSLTASEATRYIRGIFDIQEKAEKTGKTITVCTVAHSTKDGSDLAGSVNIGRFARTVISLSNIDAQHILVHVEKGRSKRVYEKYVWKRLAEPYYHFVYDPAETSAYLASQETGSSSLGKHKLKRKKIVLPDEVVDAWIKMHGEGTSYKKILDKLGRQYGLNHTNQVRRLIDDRKKVLDTEQRKSNRSD